MEDEEDADEVEDIVDEDEEDSDGVEENAGGEEDADEVEEVADDVPVELTLFEAGSEDEEETMEEDEEDEDGTDVEGPELIDCEGELEATEEVVAGRDDEVFDTRGATDWVLLPVVDCLGDVVLDNVDVLAVVLLIVAAREVEVDIVDVRLAVEEETLEDETNWGVAGQLAATSKQVCMVQKDMPLHGQGM